MKRLVWMVLGLLCSLGGRAFAEGTWDYGKIKHIVVIYQENWSFDGLYGKFPGAEGLDKAGDAIKQVDLKGRPLDHLPQPYVNEKKKEVDARFPKDMPVKPYDLSQYVPVTATTGDLVHRYYQEQVQIDGGKMDKFVAGSNNGGLVMSYFDATQLPEGKLAAQYTLCDHYFHEAFGGSFLNHIFFVAMAPPVFPDAPDSLKAQLDADGNMVKDGAVSPDGYGINTLQSVNQPHEPDTPQDQLIPSQTMPTIGDRLSDKKISWAWYSGGYDDALEGKEEGENGAGEGEFAYHHQPFVYFKNYADGTKAKKIHLKDERDLNAILDGKGKLPQVSFVKFISLDDEHPRDSDVMRGQQHTADLVNKILASTYGKDCAILITYDEHGGRWDHVAPPKGDKWGPGSRVPLIVISPFAKKGFVDHTTYTTASILKFIENRFGLESLNTRDGQAANLDHAFDFDTSATK